MNKFVGELQGLAAAMVVILLLLYGSYNYIVKPKINEITVLKSQLNMLNTEIGVVPGGQNLLRDVSSARTALNKQLDEISKKVPFEVDTPYLINDYISVVGNGLNVDYNLIQPGNLEDEAGYKRLPLKVEFAGDYANLNMYLEQLKKLPVTIRVDSLELNKLAGGKQLSVVMNLSAFVMPGGNEKAPVEMQSYSYLFDPFYSEKVEKAAPSTKIAAKPRPKVLGLRYSGYWIGKNFEAVINDDVYLPGETVKGYKIVKADKNSLTIEKNKMKIELPMGVSK